MDNLWSKNVIYFPQRGSLGVALLSPMSLSSIGRTRSLVSQSQESLDPAEPSDCDDNPHLPEAENDAEPGLVSCHDVELSNIINYDIYTGNVIGVIT